MYCHGGWSCLGVPWFSVHATLRWDTDTSRYTLAPHQEVYFRKWRSVVSYILFRIMKTFLCLPHGYADCERMFSHVQLIKTKTRNHANGTRAPKQSSYLHMQQAIQQLLPTIIVPSEMIHNAHRTLSYLEQQKRDILKTQKTMLMSNWYLTGLYRFFCIQKYLNTIVYRNFDYLHVLATMLSMEEKLYFFYLWFKGHRSRFSLHKTIIAAFTCNHKAYSRKEGLVGNLK